MSEAPLPYRAVLCDLLTALVDSNTLWGEVAGDADLGKRWRDEVLRLVTHAGTYSPYEDFVRESARTHDVSSAKVDEIIGRWGELAAYPDVVPALSQLKASGVKLGVVTNCSDEMARRAAANVGIEWDAVMSAERAGVYKTNPGAYLAGCDALGINPAEGLFVAGSAHDVPGASAVGLPVYWVNRRGLSMPPGPRPLAVSDTLDALPRTVSAGRNPSSLNPR